VNTKFTKKFQTIWELHIKFCLEKKTTCLITWIRRGEAKKKKKKKKLNPYLWEELEEGQKLKLVVGLVF
jgi:hypothetical protein